ncbi:hypothetical protein BURK1_00296 [Burkholderiales bacterium]|nr:hypothetical protein BURK1_00296 [Burkholderiales bacterium]
MESSAAAASPLSAVQAQFIQGGVAMVVASSSAQRLPSQARAVGCSVSSDRRRVTMLLRRSQCAALLEDIARSRALAVVFCQPSTHRTLQIKARDAVAQPPASVDAAALSRQADGFHRELAPLGYSAEWTRALLGYAPDDLVAVSFTPLEIFSQTPGPRAGERVA